MKRDMGVTMSDIAERAGTSVAAVSVTLNGAKSTTLKVSPETRRRIESAAEELGYRRNPHARALATGKSRILGLMLPHAFAYAVHDPFYSLLTTGVTAAASRHGYNVMLYSAAAEDEGDRAVRAIDRLVAGIVFVSPPADTELYGECESQGIPYATILAGPDGGPFTIDSDDYAGGLLATRHLVGLGHRRIAHLGGTAGVVTTEPRLRGYLDALGEADLEPLALKGEFTRASGYENTRSLLQGKAGPTAVFAANDLAAHGAIDAITEAGLSVPNDVAVVGYDDTWYATITRPTLTSVCMDVPAIGRHAAEAILNSLEGGESAPRHLRLPVSLSVRESCGGLHRSYPAPPSSSELKARSSKT
ncbi:MAG: LacI family DNA-binding transcriptional regulator [Fimbriimonas sp.]